MLPQTLAVDAMAPVIGPPLLIVYMLLAGMGLADPKFLERIDTKQGGHSIHKLMQNRADWGVLRGLLQGELEAMYVEASARAGEFTRPSPVERERFFAHAQAVGARARAWELDLPKPYLWARRVVGLALGIGWLHALSSGLDWLDHAGEAVAHSLDAFELGGGFDVHHAAGLFDLEAMLRGPHIETLVDGPGFDLPDPHGYGLPSLVDGDLRVNPVHGYFRDDGTFVRAYWRGARG